MANIGNNNPFANIGNNNPPQLPQELPPLDPQIYQGVGANRIMRYNAFFGNFDVPVARNVGIAIGEENNNNARNYISRELGISQSIERNNILADALLNPNNFFQRANLSLRDIRDIVTNRYITTFGDLLRRGYKDSEAKKEALKEAKELYEKELTVHNEKFPRDITQRVIDKMRR